MTNANTTPAAATAAPADKKVQAFYTNKEAKGIPVSIWVHTKTKDNSPDFDGLIGEQRVSGWIQKGTKRGFISFKDGNSANKGADGFTKQIATANVVANERGIPALAITMEGQKESVWADVSLKLAQDVQVACGLDLEKLAANKAAHATKKAAAA